MIHTATIEKLYKLLETDQLEKLIRIIASTLLQYRKTYSELHEDILLISADLHYTKRKKRTFDQNQLRKQFSTIRSELIDLLQKIEEEEFLLAELAQYLEEEDGRQPTEQVKRVVISYDFNKT